MQTLSISPAFEPPSQPSAAPSFSASPSQARHTSLRNSSTLEELTRLFNTVVVSSQTQSLPHPATPQDLSVELKQLTESPAFKALLNSVSQVATVSDISERDAAEAVIHCFRKLDLLWKDYVLREGLDRIRKSSFQPHPSR